MEYCQVIISATSKEEAEQLSDTLVKNRLVAGSLIVKGDSRYWWEEKIIEKEYYNVQAFSLLKNKQRIIEQVERIHSDKTPIISFSKIDGNDKFFGNLNLLGNYARFIFHYKF